MLTIENLTWDAPTGESIVKGVNLTIPDNKLVVITGPNGGGKTSLAKLIAGLEKPTGGKLLLDGTDITNFSITERAKRGMSYAFQQPVRFKGITVRELLSISCQNKLSSCDVSGLLGKVGLCACDYLDREINSSLSGGEIKRIEIASVLARHTRVSVFDEPEAGIDLWSFTNLIDVFKELRNDLKGTLIVISHQERILSIADTIVVIKDGVVDQCGGQELLPQLLAGDTSCKKCPRGREVV